MSNQIKKDFLGKANLPAALLDNIAKSAESIAAMLQVVAQAGGNVNDQSYASMVFFNRSN